MRGNSIALLSRRAHRGTAPHRSLGVGVKWGGGWGRWEGPGSLLEEVRAWQSPEDAYELSEERRRDFPTEEQHGPGLGNEQKL